MENTLQTEQQTIKSWFDKTYANRGEMYLRPKEAYYIFAELLQIKPNAKLLDVACGLGRMLEVGLDYNVKTFGIDISEVAVEKAKTKLPKATILEANAEQLPFENNTFDYVTCLGSLERMIDKDKVLSEIKRVTTDDVSICFLVRNSNSWRWLFTKKLLFTVNKDGHQDAKSYDEWKTLFDNNQLEIVNCIPDQWPVMRIFQLLTFGFFRGYKKQQKSITPLQYANEFIFILKKKS
jgi:ubiquinone/menaquinone biosynthesis C-methylase UbiE